MKQKKVFTYRFFKLGILLCLCCVILFTIFKIFNRLKTRNRDNSIKPLDLTRIKYTFIKEDAELARARNEDCSFFDCFNIYRCGKSNVDKISIYVYPLEEYKDTSGKNAFILTREYYEILQAITKSPYYTKNPNESCFFVTSMDTLNQNSIDTSLVSKALAGLSEWANGQNHIIFNMLPGTYPNYNRVLDLNTDKAIIAGAGFDSWTYRRGFDLSLPVWSQYLRNIDFEIKNDSLRNFLLMVPQINIIKRFDRLLKILALEHADVLILSACNKTKSISDKKTTTELRCAFLKENSFEYPQILGESIFCLILRGVRLGQPNFLEALAYGCIPVIAIDNYILPFEEVIDWNLAAIRIREADLHSLVNVLRAISKERICEMQTQGQWLYKKHFRNMEKITLTAIDIFNDRVFPHKAKTYNDWNLIRTPKSSTNPLFLQKVAHKSQGFTAVVLAFDRPKSLLNILKRLSNLSSLQKIIVVWNNVQKNPPNLLLPNFSKPLKIIQSKENKLSNRFYPYDEIETEAILSIDDDIGMLTADELDFGFQVWREFPDRIVGFPSRTHVWDNITNSWKYESEWKNEISMVLTGAAFYHKIWNYMYTNSMPKVIKDWVDDHKNCEDIAMNFLVANITCKSPIKVAPRKKFKCRECGQIDISSDENHMKERSKCINLFTKFYGTMPLKKVEFRVDPVLYKDKFPKELKQFNDIGSL